MIWELSSAGRASALQAGGHRFDPYSSHQSPNTEYIWELSSAGRASALQAGGHRFDPYSSHQSPDAVAFGFYFFKEKKYEKVLIFCY